MKNEIHFKVGQRVWSFTNGWGTVICDKLDGDFPIEVKFDKDKSNNITITHTKDGRERLDETRVLFFQEIPIPKEALRPARWRANKGSSRGFYFINSCLEVEFKIDVFNYSCDMMWHRGNYFKTPEECIKAIESINSLLIGGSDYEFL